MQQRIIKFRARALTLDRRWVYGSYLEKDSQVYIFDETNKWEVPADSSTVGQFTGLLDRTGREICEGDILRWNPDGLDWVVRWIDGAWRMNASNDHEEVKLHENLFNGRSKHLEVIGNIHENPELLNPTFFPAQGSVSLHEDEDAELSAAVDSYWRDQPEPADNQIYDPAKDPSLEKEEQEPIPF
jgi:uncharacterized phage protein (TIGR01671 family)